MPTLVDASGRVIAIGRQLGKGGEGRVLECLSHPATVAKLYADGKNTTERRQKLEAMIAYPPRDDARTSHGHPTVAWPQMLIHDIRGEFVGFLMDRIDLRQTHPLFTVYHPHFRPPAFTWKRLLRAAGNLAAVVATLHDNAFVVGDMNDENIQVSPAAMVTIIDCDSMQVVDRRTGATYRSSVGVDEYSAREVLAQSDYGNVNRTPATDNFSLAVLIFKLLVNGVHPFAGGPNSTVAANIRAGASFVIEDQHAAPPTIIPPAILSNELRGLFVRCFREGHGLPPRRPTAAQWSRALAEAEQTIVGCRIVPTHEYGVHLDRCPWCAYTAQTGNEFFPAVRS